MKQFVGVFFSILSESLLCFQSISLHQCPYFASNILFAVMSHLPLNILNLKTKRLRFSSQDLEVSVFF